MGSPRGWDVSHGEVEIEETDAAAAGKKSTTSLSVYGLEVEDEVSTVAT